MGGGRWSASGWSAGLLAVAALAGTGPVAAGKAPPRSPPATYAAALRSGKASVETVTFADRPHARVRVVRGPAPPAPAKPVPVPPRQTEIVSFGNGFADRVMVIRGGVSPPAIVADQWGTARPEVEKVAFADPLLPAVTIVRGTMLHPDPLATGLFGPADAGELDRIAFAVDGLESRHGADLRMWRPELDGPQGPMQVSAAAAFDVGGGDRFDLRENRLLGRAYLAQMFRRYGNWPDALAAYNWGPGNVDQWIAAGHDFDRLPPGVLLYVARALHDALIAAGGL